MMNINILNNNNECNLNKNNITDYFKVGDKICVHNKINEGNKERVQIFSGIVISKKGSGVQQKFTLRKITQGEGVERIFSIYSPNISNIILEKQSIQKRARMFYLRDKIGKAVHKIKMKK